mgnify:CR=1 FL=1
MTVTTVDSAIYGSLLSDAELVALFDDAAQISAMLVVEAALARAEAAVGAIPAEAGEAIALAIERAIAEGSPRPDELAAGTAAAGVPIPALVERLRALVGGEAAQYVHWGATSQDITDTGLVLRLVRATAIMQRRLQTLIAALATLADAHRDTIMVGRTRGQQAVPITFGLKAAGWLAPLLRDRERLDELGKRVFVLQFGGAAGNLSALDNAGQAVARALATELRLGNPAMPWHSQRDVVTEYAGWLTTLSANLGKIGLDVMLLTQNEVGELRIRSESGQGGSSTMPQKINPVPAEVLVTMARSNASLNSGLQQAALQEHERGGPGWQMEWLGLPPLAVQTGCALNAALDLVARLEVQTERMRANLDASNGLALAEAASFALSQHLPRAEAQAMTKAACRKAVAENRNLFDVLAIDTDIPVDWPQVADPANYLGSNAGLIDAVLHQAHPA